MTIPTPAIFHAIYRPSIHGGNSVIPHCLAISSNAPDHTQLCCSRHNGVGSQSFLTLGSEIGFGW